MCELFKKQSPKNGRQGQSCEHANAFWPLYTEALIEKDTRYLGGRALTSIALQPSARSEETYSQDNKQAS